MRRGYLLENELNRIIAYLASIGVHGHKNHPNRTVTGIFKEGEPFDYEVLSAGKLYCFDAKECQASRWSLTNAKPLQVKHLLDCKENGADAFFLVYFAPERKVIKFDVEFIRQAIASGTKSLAPNEGTVWSWEELLPTSNRG